MCGRTCCTLSPDVLPYACTVVTKNPPDWVGNDVGYKTSTNIAPTSYTPVLVNHDDKTMLQSMMWG